ncbi:hypothetical protein AV530_005771 [Patagioenas fasciata monilis]|uniref:Uncharacterized protein n=1 Tax=Patagioenas fasciata monilis TaxID=372326 RepID=A0A1V4JMT0_PATFA|nr:hypothetical protein AV530_005771 [Patagioenas fasciata monilis]
MLCAAEKRRSVVTNCLEQQADRKTERECSRSQKRRTSSILRTAHSGGEAKGWGVCFKVVTPTPRSVKKEGEEVLQVLEKIPLQAVVQTMVTLDVPLQSVEVHGGAEIHLQHVEESMPAQVYA